MSRSKKYIDLEETMLFTCNNLYDYSLKLLPSLLAITDGIPDDQGLPPKVIERFTPKIITEMYQTVNRYLTGALLFGKAEATLGLAYLHREGLGVDESEYHDTLYRYIGAELGDQTCKVLLLQQDHRLQLDYRYVVPEGEKWLKAIKVITARYPNKNAEITSAAIEFAQKQLKYYCGKQHSLYPTKVKPEF